MKTIEQLRQAVIEASMAFVDARQLVRETDLHNPARPETWLRAENRFDALKSALAALRNALAAPETSALPDGLWNYGSQSEACWARIDGTWYWVSSDLPGVVQECNDLVRSPDASIYPIVPNTWPIPEAAKARLRELGLKLPDDETVETENREEVMP